MENINMYKYIGYVNAKSNYFENILKFKIYNNYFQLVSD